MSSEGAGDVIITNNEIPETNTATVENLGAGGDMKQEIDEIKQEKEQIIMEEDIPPLPISPPPSKLVAFALNTETLEDMEDDGLKAQTITKENEDKVAEVVNKMSEMNISEAELEATATATYLVDEITSKAIECVTEMAHVMQHELKNEAKNEEETTISSNVRKENADEEEEEEEGEEFVDNNVEILPPPPPTPPLPTEIELETEIETGTPGNEIVADSVEEVLQQFETKLSEIEEHSMNLDATGATDEFEECQFTTPQSLNDEECMAIIDKLIDDDTESSIVANLDENEEQEFETFANATEEIFNLEDNKQMEHDNSAFDVEFLQDETSEIETTANVSELELETSRIESGDETKLLDEINKLTLDDVHIETSSTELHADNGNNEHENFNSFDLKNVKVNTTTTQTLVCVFSFSLLFLYYYLTTYYYYYYILLLFNTLYKYYTRVLTRQILCSPIVCVVFCYI